LTSQAQTVNFEQNLAFGGMSAGVDALSPNLSCFLGRVTCQAACRTETLIASSSDAAQQQKRRRSAATFSGGLAAGGVPTDHWGSPMELFEGMYGKKTGVHHGD
jgi:hypothetical protein